MKRLLEIYRKSAFIFNALMIFVGVLLIVDNWAGNNSYGILDFVLALGLLFLAANSLYFVWRTRVILKFEEVYESDVLLDEISSNTQYRFFGDIFSGILNMFFGFCLTIFFLLTIIVSSEFDFSKVEDLFRLIIVIIGVCYGLLKMYYSRTLLKKLGSG